MPEALLIIDFQNDFTAGGALEVPDGHTIADRLNEMAADPRYDLVVATRDWHPPDHGSFDERGGIWPVHCVQGSEGAELHPDLDRSRLDLIIDKGQDPGAEGYSAFEATGLDELLRDRGIDRVTVAGLATDVCVLNTARDALELGFDVEVDREGSRGVDVEEGASERALEELRSRGAEIR